LLSISLPGWLGEYKEVADFKNALNEFSVLYSEATPQLTRGPRASVALAAKLLSRHGVDDDSHDETLMKSLETKEKKDPGRWMPEEHEEDLVPGAEKFASWGVLRPGGVKAIQLLQVEPTLSGIFRTHEFKEFG